MERNASQESRRLSERPSPEITKQIRRDYEVDWSDPQSHHYFIRNRWSGRRTCTAFGTVVKINKVELRAHDIWYYLINHDWSWELDPDYVEPEPPRAPSIHVGRTR
jgi:hypothetical protein